MAQTHSSGDLQLIEDTNETKNRCSVLVGYIQSLPNNTHLLDLNPDRQQGMLDL